MKNIAFGLMLIGCVAGCSTPAPRTEPLAVYTIPNSDLSFSVVATGGPWRYADHRWKDGVLFCEYRAGRNKVIQRMDDFKVCPLEIKAEK